MYINNKCCKFFPETSGFLEESETQASALNNARTSSILKILDQKRPQKAKSVKVWEFPRRRR